jgi:hypothetical protein
MAQTNAQNQDEYKKRMREAGFRRAEAWIHPDDAAELRRIAAQMRDHRLTGKGFRLVITREMAPDEERKPTPPGERGLMHPEERAEKCPSHETTD